MCTPAKKIYSFPYIHKGVHDLKDWQPLSQVVSEKTLGQSVWYISFQISLFLASLKTDFAESIKTPKIRNVNGWIRGSGHSGLSAAQVPHWSESRIRAGKTVLFGVRLKNLELTLRGGGISVDSFWEGKWSDESIALGKSKCNQCGRMIWKEARDTKGIILQYCVSSTVFLVSLGTWHMWTGVLPQKVARVDHLGKCRVTKWASFHTVIFRTFNDCVLLNVALFLY